MNETELHLDVDRWTTDDGDIWHLTAEGDRRDHEGKPWCEVKAQSLGTGARARYSGPGAVAWCVVGGVWKSPPPGLARHMVEVWSFKIAELCKGNGA
jgi:hypothetical protein